MIGITIHASDNPPFKAIDVMDKIEAKMNNAADDNPAINSSLDMGFPSRNARRMNTRGHTNKRYRKMLIKYSPKATSFKIADVG